MVIRHFYFVTSSLDCFFCFDSRPAVGAMVTSTPPPSALSLTTELGRRFFYLARGLDVLLPRHEDQDVSGRTRKVDLESLLHGGFDVVFLRRLREVPVARAAAAAVTTRITPPWKPNKTPKDTHFYFLWPNYLPTYQPSKILLRYTVPYSAVRHGRSCADLSHARHAEGALDYCHYRIMY